MKIKPSQRWELIFGAAVWLFAGSAILIAAGPLAEISSSALLGSCIFTSVGVLFAYAEMMRRSFQVEIDRDMGGVKIQRRNWRSRLIREIYTLERFNRVRSIFAMCGKYPKVRVELVEGKDSRALTLAVLTPKSYLSDYEPDEAARLRREIVELTDLIDSGFEGVMVPLLPSSPDCLE